jgi:hypothetical protein
MEGFYVFNRWDKNRDNSRAVVWHLPDEGRLIIAES